ncbi:bile salt-activated lipase-like isoform X1 [Agelaius phoeniceus]|uniref:bile salt-activated lipase-like isoform X1 n=1 Tax=Agelaius phoeniceus TaxID=39638 RepID=UPI004054EEDF
MAHWHILVLALCSYLGVAWAATLGVVHTEGGFVEGENKKLGLLGNYVDIFRGIPFAAPPRTLEDPQPHPGWDGKVQLLNAFGLGLYFHFSLLNLAHMGNGTTYYSDWSQWLGRLCCHCTVLREERMGEQTTSNQRMELMPLTRTCCLPFPLLGTLEAKEFKKRCMQVKLTQTDVRGSEDCLYLNIWVPQGRKQVSTKLPVMIYIYGGAFLLGGGQGANFLDNYLYDGEEIAVRGNVIVVTINYRVGPLGFLSTGDENLPGNYGLKDQHMAIAWVKRNIKAFGGDPDNITIFGESAGAASVSLQTLSPKNKGLFKRAISQSGVGLCSWAIQRDPLVWAKKLGEKVGCSTDNTTVLANCLRISDPKALTLAYHLQLTHLPMPLVHTLAFSPVVDGDFLPEMPEKLFANAADIDYLAGVNNMDGHMFAGVDVPAINRPLVKVTADQVYNLIKGLTVDRGEAGANATYNIYTQSWGDKPDQEVVKKTVVDLITDYIFLIPTQVALNLHLQNAKSGKTYSYVFSEPSRMPIYPRWVGADHADDLQYVFGKPFATPLGYWPKHRTLSKAIIAYWTNFARTGDPNNGHSDVPVSWPAYTDKSKYYLDINHKMTKNSVKQDLRSRFVTFWNSVYLKLPQVANISQSELMF